MILLKSRLAVLFPAQDRRKQLIHSGILIVWALIQYALRNKLYALFIIIFFLILSISKRPNFIMAAVSVLAIVLFNFPISNTAAELKGQNLHAIQNYKTTLYYIFTPGSGEEALPATVRHVLLLLKSNHVPSYQLSDQLYQDPLLMQRIVESAWPIKMDGTSPYRLSLSAEMNNTSTCTFIDQIKDAVLAYCH